MTTQYIFSIETMKGCNGNVQSDGVYRKWFLDECVARLGAAARTIKDTADGRWAIDVDPLAVARARLGEVRFYSAAMEECANWFTNGKPSIAEEISKASKSIAEIKDKAEIDFQKLSSWLA